MDQDTKKRVRISDTNLKRKKKKQIKKARPTEKKIETKQTGLVHRKTTKFIRPTTVLEVGVQPKINSSTVIKEPYEVSSLRNLFNDDTFVQQLRADILEKIELHEKNNDLYKFAQSKDIIVEIKSGKSKTIEKFIQLIKQVVRPAIAKDIGLDLDPSHIDMTVSRYDCGDYLLCHNDDIKRIKNNGRLVAFIYYLVDRDWTPEDGGSLQILSSDSKDAANSRLNPTTVNCSLCPKANSLIYFRTTEKSWHAVEEVKHPDGCRLSINGWFHGSRKKSKSDDQWVEVNPIPKIVPLQDEDGLDKLFLSWVNHDYMMEKTWKRVSKTFSETSEISLTEFLAKDKYDKLCDALTKSVKKKQNWSLVGPLNFRNYKRADILLLPSICQELIRIFRSNLFFLMLAKITGLNLENDNTDSDNDHSEQLPSCKMEFRSWQKSFYTLIHDHSEENNESNALDCILHFNHDFEVDHDNGGFISYIAKGEDEELLTVEPKSNCLSLIYRDSETTRFVKYLSNNHQGHYQDLSCVYYPKPSDESSSSSDSSSE